MTLFKKIFILLITIAVCSVLVSSTSLAGSGERKGFFLSIGPHADGELNDLQKFGGGGTLRIGAGITENFLLYYEGSHFITSKNSYNVSTHDLSLKGQFYLWENLYTNLGVGFSIGANVLNGVRGPSFLSDLPDSGWTISWGLGNDFRIGEKFFIAPELTFRYHRFNSSIDLLTPGLLVNLGWHF